MTCLLVTNARAVAQWMMSRRMLRGTTRGLVLLAALLVLGPAAGSGSFPATLSGLSPYVAVGAGVATHVVPIVAWLAVMTGVMAVARRRFFCDWMCPTGLALDGAGKVGRVCGRLPVGRRSGAVWLVWLTLGSALVGLPLFLWLDPLALFTAAFSLPREDAGNARWYAASVVFLLLVLNAWWPGQWCRQVCPLGAIQDGFYIGGRRLRDRWRSSESSRPLAIGDVSSRRAWLGLAGGTVAGLMGGRVSAAPDLLRPPGAVAADSFAGVCLRCGNCLRACPSGVIRSTGLEGGVLALFTPSLSFAEDYCREDCVRCGDVCPSGALQRIPLELKPGVDLGKPKVRMDLCLLAEERECSHCRNWCPYGAITYVFSEASYMLEPRVDFDRCNGCGACEAHCPVRPKRAIVVERNEHRIRNSTTSSPALTIPATHL